MLPKQSSSATDMIIPHVTTGKLFFARKLRPHFELFVRPKSAANQNTNSGKGQLLEQFRILKCSGTIHQLKAFAAAA
jgi:hypothetical protein